MGQARFPDAIDNFGLTLPRSVHNATSQTNVYTLVEAYYAIIEIQKAILSGIQVDVISPVSVNTSALESRIAALESKIALLPEHWEASGPPAASLGKNGDTYSDIHPTASTGDWMKSAGIWRQ